MAFRSDEDKKAYWQKNLNLMFVLLVIWAVVSYGFGILLRPVLDAIPVGGVGLGYAKKMRELDREFGVDDDE